MTEIISKRFELEFKALFKRLLDEGTSEKFEQLIKRIEAYLEVRCPSSTLEKLACWHQNIAGHYFLHQLIAGDQFEELVFFGKDYITKDGALYPGIDLSPEDYLLAWTQLAFDHSQAWNHAHPFVSFAATIANKTVRITLTHPCCAPDNTLRAFVRAHAPEHFKISDFTRDPEAQSLLEQHINERKNILVIGATQSGKTSLIGSLIDSIEPDDHVVILEDTHELSRSSRRTTSMLADRTDEKRSLSEYCAMALRMSPDRIILGEIRSNEVVPLILAFNSGHRGGLSSLHADSVVDGLERLALLFHLYGKNSQLPHHKVMELVCRNIDVVVYIKDKQIIEIAHINGSEAGTPLFETGWINQTAKPSVSGAQSDDSWWKKASAH
ncbi:MAG: CpaF/VirB11 family protein [bacterium]